MNISSHISISALVAAGIWYFTGSLLAGFLCFISGGLIDADHILEYAINYGWKGLTIKKVYDASQQSRSRKKVGYKKLHLIFHSVELLGLLWILYIITNSIYIFALAIGMTIHLIMDYAGNRVYPLSYFFVWRAIKGFDAHKITKEYE
jgi:hypothetical protein